jgi:hypothetical protein
VKGASQIIPVNTKVRLLRSLGVYHKDEKGFVQTPPPAYGEERVKGHLFVYFPSTCQGIWVPEEIIATL